MHRDVVSLDGLWEFQYAGHADAAPVSAPWRAAQVPLPWQAQFDDLRLAAGRASYRRQLVRPAAWDGDRVFLCFGAVTYLARVLIDGVPVGAHEGGYLPFEFDVTTDLADGLVHELRVEVVAPDDDSRRYPLCPLGEIPFGKQSWYGPTSGIWQSVRLERRHAFHLTELRLVPVLDTGRVGLTVATSPLETEPHGEIEIEIRDPSGTVVAMAPAALTGGTRRLELSLAVPRPEPWSPDRPALYRCRVSLLRDGRLVDRRESTFGFRRIETRDGRLYLNGEPLYLRGALDQDYYPDGICTPPGPAFLEDQLLKAKQLGLNCLRCHIKVPDPAYYEVADRLGMLIWSELPNGGRLSPAARRRAEETLDGILARDGNHPSIVIWTIVNENWGTDLVHDPAHRDWLRGMVERLKAADPTRLVVDNSPLWPSFHVRSDIADVHFYKAIPDHRAEWDAFVAEYASGRLSVHSPAGDAEVSGHEVRMISEFGNWGLPDPAALAGTDGREPWWFETGHDWGEGIMYPHGLEQRFRSCSLDRVFGSLSGFVAATQWQQFAALKYQIESMRREKGLGGYVITELTDVHWECNGLLDMRRNPRVFHERLRDVNADTVILPAARAAAWSGDTLEVGIQIAHGGRRPIEAPQLSVRIAGVGAVLADLPDLVPGDVTPSVTMSLRLPPELPASSLAIDVELFDGERTYARNSAALAVLPRRKPADPSLHIWTADPARRAHLAALGYQLASDPAKAGLLLAASIDAALEQAIREGARALILADAAMPVQPLFPHWQNVQVLSRDNTPWRGDWASSFAWLRRDGAFAALPGGQLLDHAFERVIPTHVVANCNWMDFQARVHAELVVGWVHKAVALSVERDYGQGRFLLATFRLFEDAAGADPMATALLDALITTVTRRDGDPTHEREIFAATATG